MHVLIIFIIKELKNISKYIEKSIDVKENCLKNTLAKIYLNNIFKIFPLYLIQYRSFKFPLVVVHVYINCVICIFSCLKYNERSIYCYSNDIVILIIQMVMKKQKQNQFTFESRLSKRSCKSF